MEVSVALQLKEFLFSICFGLFLGAVYDIFRILRVAFPSSKGAVFVEDSLFFILASVLTFSFIFNINNGQIRLFLLLGTFLGATVYYFTIGILVIKSAKTVIKILDKFFCAVIKVIFYPIKVIYNFAHPIYKKNAQNMRIIKKNIANHFIFKAKQYKMNINTMFSKNKDKNKRNSKLKSEKVKGVDYYGEKKKSKSNNSDRLIQHSSRFSN